MYAAVTVGTAASSRPASRRSVRQYQATPSHPVCC